MKIGVRILCHAVSVLSTSLLLIVSALAATIEIETAELSGEIVSFITITGELKFGDEGRFADAAIGLRSAGVLFNGPGGNLGAGIQIGKAIRLKGFATLVGEGSICSSACALAWLGGRHRFMANEHQVGFHAASIVERPGEAHSAANALVGAYLNEMGFAADAIAYMTLAQPDEMRWLSFDDAEQYGIDVLSLTATGGSGLSTRRETERDQPNSMPEDWASYGDWIQIFSRQRGSLAATLARDYGKQIGLNTAVFRYDNGWFVVVVGPFPPGSGDSERRRLLRRKAIPEDSIVANSIRFTDLVWGNLPRAPATSRAPAMDRSADVVDAAYEFFRATSLPPAAALDYLQRSYAPKLEYYGHRVPKAEVLDEKREFVERWPLRKYRVGSRPIVRCISGTCTAEGVVTWWAHSGERERTSTGTASFSLTFAESASGFLLIGESGEVLTRKITAER